MSEELNMTPKQTLAFFASVIKSGEPWTGTCQKAYDEAMAALASPMTALTPAAEEDRGEPDDSWKEALEGDLFGLVGSAALAAGVTVTVEQSLAIAHAVMRYMLADESLPRAALPPSKE